MLLNKYIIKTLLQTTAVVIIALISMDFFIQLISEFDDLGHGSYGLTQALYFVLLRLPNDIYQLFSIAGLIGCLLGLGLLASHSELIVMRAAGMSISKVSLAVLYAVLLLVLLAMILGEVVAPWATREGNSYKTIAKSGGQAVATAQGIWLRDSNAYIHINKVLEADHLQGVSRYQFDEEHHLTDVSFAQQAAYQAHQWHMQDISGTHMQGNNITTYHTAADIWSMTLNPMVLKMVQIQPQEMSLLKLYEYIHYRKKNHLQYAPSALNFWQRLFEPIGTCVMMLLAIPFIFGPLRSVTMGLRLVAGVIVGFSFYLLNQFFGPFSLVYHLPPVLAAGLPVGVFGAIGIYLMRRLK